ncbi:acyltransferase [Conexibacter sp. DBS9H8]|uniref:acyltransferase family protein n=1 Tax=Conexibacter sp. DBS9H8 TaxID=2937801 RepID=UPI00200CF9C6|nr:acyltransferase family protein [Conexibacter sp. DBS9H8]
MTVVSSRSHRTELAHVNGLDGLRGLAVIVVVLYHGGVSWANGGFLGVELFFVLSGFLITSLLVREWVSERTVTLRRFWARRARRLLPALFVLVVVIGIFYALKGTYGAVPGLFGDGLSALFYYSNWHQIAVGSSYFAQTGPTSPFQHTWSLAIEEQFYLLWPLLLLGVATLLTLRRQRGGRAAPFGRSAIAFLDVMIRISGLLLVASAIDSLVLFHGGSGLNRVYFGTDTRATGLLSGAILAFIVARLRLTGRLPPAGWPVLVRTRAAGARSRAQRPPWPTPAISLASGAAILLLLILVVTVSGDDHWLYPWGFLLTDGLTVAVIAVIVTTPRSIANRVFSMRWLRGVGAISYGLYLWHFPLFLWLNDSATGLSGFPLLIVRITVALAVSIASYHLVEQPIRQRRWPAWIVHGLAPVTAGAGIISLALAASAAAIPTAATAPVPTIHTDLAGTDPACAVTLANTPTGGAVAPPSAQEASFQTSSLARGAVRWPSATTTTRFRTCPPKRALVIGDSIAFTIGVPLLYSEQHYGMAIADAAILGCSFATRGEIDVNGTWETVPKGCPNEIATWQSQANAFGANEVIFELGYRDEFNFKWNGQLVHLGEPAFDRYVEARIRRFISVLGENGRRKLLFLSIPFVNPPPQANGSPAPQASTARRDEINRLITEAAAADHNDAAVLHIDRWLAPQGHYSTDVNGQLCRFDGIHVTIYCGDLLAPHIFMAGRALLAH